MLTHVNLSNCALIPQTECASLILVKSSSVSSCYFPTYFFGERS